MKKIIILTLACFAIALLPQTVSAQTEVAPEPAIKKKAQKKTVREEKKVIYHKRTDMPVRKARTEKTPGVKAEKATKKEAGKMKKADQKTSANNKPVELIVKPLKGTNKKVVKPKNVGKNPKQ